jgi:hypothetical protein
MRKNNNNILAINLMKRFLIANKKMSSLIIASILIAGGLSLVSFEKILALPSEIVEDNYIFGNIVGIVEENENPIWIIFGNWKTNLGNQTQIENGFKIYDSSFEMVESDGTSRHTHTLTNFELGKATELSESTMLFNGTSTISMKDGPIEKVPTSIQIMNNTLVSMWIDPDKVNNHFGNDLIYGITIEESQNQ